MHRQAPAVQLACTCSAERMPDAAAACCTMLAHSAFWCGSVPGPAAAAGGAALAVAAGARALAAACACSHEQSN